MMSMRLGGLIMCVIGWVLAILACALPMWKVTSFMGSGMKGSQELVEGLWLNCITDGMGQMQCKAYDSLMDVPSDLQVARSMVVNGLFMSFVALILFFVGTDYPQCMDRLGEKKGFTMVAGALYITTGTTVLVPVSWVTDNIINNFYPMGGEAVKKELGAAIYIGFIASVLLIVGGITLCRSAHQPQPYPRKYKGVKTCDEMGCPMKDYV